MSIPQKDNLARWLPLAVALISNVVVVAYGYGKLEQRIVPVEQHATLHSNEVQMRIFVTRGEWDMRNQTRDRELETLKSELGKVQDKLDRILERLSR